MKRHNVLPLTRIPSNRPVSRVFLQGQCATCWKTVNVCKCIAKNESGLTFPEWLACADIAFGGVCVRDGDADAHADAWASWVLDFEPGPYGRALRTSKEGAQ
jgi:hypothetical protein